MVKSQAKLLQKSKDGGQNNVATDVETPGGTGSRSPTQESLVEGKPGHQGLVAGGSSGEPRKFLTLFLPTLFYSKP